MHRLFSCKCLMLLKNVIPKEKNLLSEKFPSFYLGRIFQRLKIMINQFSGIHSQIFSPAGNKLNAVVAEKVTTIWVFRFSYNHCDKMNFESMRSFFIVCTFVDKSFPLPLSTTLNKESKHTLSLLSTIPMQCIQDNYNQYSTP